MVFSSDAVARGTSGYIATVQVKLRTARPRSAPARRTLLLISPPVLYGDGWWTNRIANKPHFASLAGNVRDLAEVKTLELDIVAGAPLEPLLAQVEAALAEGGVALAGLSCWTSLHYLGALTVARRLRQLAPGLPIAIGGHHATAMP